MLKNKIKIRYFVILFALILAPIAFTIISFLSTSDRDKKTSAAGWYSYDWNYRKSITIDHTKVAADETDYPLLVNLPSDADLAGEAQADGDDIVFIGSDGTTKLDHEIEKYVSATGELVAWVDISSLSSSLDTLVYMYYSNPSCASQQNPAGVFGSDYALVQHLNEASGTIYDSTSNNNDATQYGGVTYSATGKIGSAVGINSADDHLRITDNSSVNLGTAVSVEGWIKSKPVTSDVVDLGAIEVDNNTKGNAYPADLDGDGDMDIISNDQTIGAVVWYQNNGSENFAKESLYSLTNPYDLVSHDFDGDGDLDIAGTSQYNDVFWLENNGSEVFALHDVYTAWNQAIHLVKADINSDGNMDIVATSFYSNQWAWFENDGVGNFTIHATSTSAQTNYVDAGDIDNDGDVDVVITTNSGGELLWFENDGSEVFASNVVITAYAYLNSVYVVDLDKDGHKDILVGRTGGSSTMQILWFRNDGTETFLAPVDLVGYVRDGAYCMPVDLDNDGDIDILGGSGHREVGLVWWENNGSQVFTGRTIKNGVYGAGKPWAVDIDSDGDLDILSKFSYSSTVHSLYLWKNNGVGLVNKGSQYYQEQNGLSAYLAPGGKIKALISDAGQDQCKVTSTIEVDDDTLRHLAVTWDGSDLKIYLNGALDASATCSNVGSLTNTNNVTIGKGADVIFDEFRLSTSALGSNRIATIYENQNSPSTFYDIEIEEKGDITDPANPSVFKAYNNSGKTDEFIDNSWHNQISPYFEWSNASDSQSGVAGYFVYFGKTIDADPVATGSYQTGANFTSGTVLETGEDYYFRMVTRDRAGNDSDAGTLFTYRYDGTAPSPPSYVNVSPVGCSTQSTFDFSWPEATDSGGSNLFGYQYKKGSTGSPTFTDQLTLQTTPYQEGDNVLFVQSIDNAGNTSSWQSGVYCSTGVALVVDGPEVNAGPASISVNWTSSKETTGYVKVYEGNSYVSEQGHTSYSISHSVRVLGLEPERAYRYQIVWVDSNGNLGESEWFETSTSEAPSIKDFKANVVSPFLAVVSWQTTLPSSSTMEYGESGFDNLVSFDGNSTSFSREISNLSGGKTYNIRITARTEENFPYYYTTSFSTPPPPSISNLSFESITTSATPSLKVTWTTNVETTSSVFYKTEGDPSYKEITSSDTTTAHELNISSLVDSTTYQLYAFGIDEYGNIAKSEVNTFQTPIDSRPPTVSDIAIETSNVGLGNQDEAQIVVSWKTDEPASSFVEYGEGISGDDYNFKTNIDPTFTTSHLVIISGLKESTPYHLRVASTDKGDNTSYSTDNTVIPGEVKKSTLTLILAALSNAFGWLSRWF